MSEQAMSASPALPDLGCACAAIRRASRLVTQLYSREMGGELEPAQFSVLSALKRKPGMDQGAVARLLGLDKTTASRGLRLMEKNGWIALTESSDQRSRRYVLTAAGKTVLQKATPGWKRAQSALGQAFGEAEFDALRATLDCVSHAALKSG